MQITHTGRNCDVTQALLDYAKKKLQRVQRHAADVTNIDLTFTVENASNKAEQQIVEATVSAPGKIIQATEKTEDMYKSLDGVVDKLDRQLKKHREKHNNH